MRTRRNSARLRGERSNKRARAPIVPSYQCGIAWRVSTAAKRKSNARLARAFLPGG